MALRPHARRQSTYEGGGRLRRRDLLKRLAVLGAGLQGGALAPRPAGAAPADISPTAAADPTGDHTHDGTYVGIATDETVTGSKTFQQRSGFVPLRISSAEESGGAKLFEILGPSRTGTPERYTFMVDAGGQVKMNTSLVISGATSSGAGNVPPDPVPGESQMLGILNDLPSGYPSILSRLGIDGQVHLRAYDTSGQLQFELDQHGGVRVQLWDASAVGLSVRAAYRHHGALVEATSADGTPVFRVDPLGSVSSGPVMADGDLSVSRLGNPRIGFVGQPAFSAGLSCESGNGPNDVVNFGINDVRFGRHDPGRPGGFLRFDTRPENPVATVYIREPSKALRPAISVRGDGTVELHTPGRGLVLRSPNGSPFHVSVADDGTLSAVAV